MKKITKIGLILVLSVFIGVSLCACGLFSTNTDSDNSSSGGNSGGNSTGNNPPIEDTDGTFIYSGSSIKAANSTISGTIIIPTEHNGTPIDTIPANAFKDCTAITSIEVPNSVTSIGYGAFNGCSLLRSITLPFVGSEKGNSGRDACFGYIFGSGSYQGGTNIRQDYGSSASAYTYSYIPSVLRTVTIKNESIIGYGAFNNCSMLTTIIINSAAKSQIGTNAFKNTVSPTWMD